MPGDAPLMTATDGGTRFASSRIKYWPSNLDTNINVGDVAEGAFGLADQLRQPLGDMVGQDGRRRLAAAPPAGSPKGLEQVQPRRHVDADLAALAPV